jgi:hypothetical protein
VGDKRRGKSSGRGDRQRSGGQSQEWRANKEMDEGGMKGNFCKPGSSGGQSQERSADKEWMREG